MDEVFLMQSNGLFFLLIVHNTFPLNVV